MKLSTLLRAVPAARVLGDAQVEVREVVEDSREVAPGDLFVAVSRGADGHRFVPQAIERGAAAVVVERPLDVAVPQVIVPSGGEALGELVAESLGRPADRMILVGITGTNGKTTTTYLVESILAAAGARPAVLGTVSYRWGGKVQPSAYTTPTPRLLHRTFADIAAAGCTHVVMEVSSAALAMDRLAGVRFQAAAFTNLTQDHLDVHGSMEAYQAAKQLLFTRHLAAGGAAAINVDDPAAPAMIAAAGERRVLRVSIDPAAAAEVRVDRFTSTVAGIRARVVAPRGPIDLESAALLGGYNVANLAMAAAIAEVLGVDHAAIAAGIAAMTGVPGRVERVANDQGLDILVDYAHTPDALDNVLAALRPLTRRRLICVFGCGGDRDPGKRPKMGAAVARGADLAVVTSDNPRTEDPRAIIEQILPGVPEPFFVDVDRRTAIRAAVAEATPGDIVLIAGKGHEDYQIIGTSKTHFDDREEAAAAAAARWRFPLDVVLKETGGRLLRGTAREFARVHYDGRIAAPGDLYVAVRGETHDGHAFIGQAVEAGATGVIVERGAPHPALPPSGGEGSGPVIIEVDDGRVALGAIARWHSRRWGLANPKARLIAVTGSAGKTTTKQLIAAALSGAGRVHASAGSLNNETGVPFTLLGLKAHHDFAVVEMGMRGVGQIAYLCSLAEPHVGVVTNAGVAHVGVVGSVDDIARGKAEIFAGLPSYGCAIFPAGDPRLAAHAAPAPRKLTFGDEPGADVRLVEYLPLRPAQDFAGPAEAGADVVLAVGGARHRGRVPLPGRHNALNAACAVAAALAVGVAPEVALAGIAAARPAAMRGEVRTIAGRRVLVDCYNANPAAMQAALTTLAELAAGGRALAVIGDMLELGDESAAAHRQAGRAAAELGVEVVALGEQRDQVVAGATAAGGRAAAAADPADAARRALGATAPGDWLLVKGSRGMRLERVIQAMESV